MAPFLDAHVCLLPSDLQDSHACALLRAARAAGPSANRLDTLLKRRLLDEQESYLVL